MACKNRPPFPRFMGVGALTTSEVPPKPSSASGTTALIALVSGAVGFGMGLVIAGK